MSAQEIDVCRKCGGTAETYTEYKIQYLSTTCWSKTCRYFYSECEGQTEADCFLDYDEWLEKVPQDEEEED